MTFSTHSKHHNWCVKPTYGMYSAYIEACKLRSRFAVSCLSALHRLDTRVEPALVPGGLVLMDDALVD
jgi:hypothetical protein